jgi:hypothetical protein
MSEACEKCGADISFQSEQHANCDKVAAYRSVLQKLAKDWPHICDEAREVLERHDDING